MEYITENNKQYFPINDLIFPQKTINDYLSLFALIKLKGFSIVYRDDLISSFKGAPLELEALIKMKIKTEEIAEYRKIYREINKIIIG